MQGCRIASDRIYIIYYINTLYLWSFISLRYIFLHINTNYLCINALHSYVECDSTLVFSSGAASSSAKEKQDCILEIVSRYIIHLKITKYNNSVNKTGI